MSTEFDFDQLIDRRSTGSAKWRRREGDDVIPLGVADMDFPSPSAVIEALQSRIDHGVFGYTYPTPALTETVQEMLESSYGWEVRGNWIVWLPGLVAGLNAVCRIAGEPGDEVLTATPVYPPFLTAPDNMGRELRCVMLDFDDQHWTFNFDELETAINPRTKLFLLCNPHNPVGRVFTRQELTTLADLCLRHGLTICADEIHCELILDREKEHIPLATLSPEIAAQTITFMSPSKTFNLAGIGCAFAVIPDARLRRAFRKATTGIIPHVNTLGYTACLAAYRDGGAWRRALLDYLRDNRDLALQMINDTPGISANPIEATYLAWIDTRAADIQEPGQFFLKAGVDMWDGVDFGGPGFIRLNFGLPRDLLREGLLRIQQAMQNRS